MRQRAICRPFRQYSRVLTLMELDRIGKVIPLMPTMDYLLVANMPLLQHGIADEVSQRATQF